MPRILNNEQLRIEWNENQGSKTVSGQNHNKRKKKLSLRRIAAIARLRVFDFYRKKSHIWKPGVISFFNNGVRVKVLKLDWMAVRAGSRNNPLMEPPVNNSEQQGQYRRIRDTARSRPWISNQPTDIVTNKPARYWLEIDDQSFLSQMCDFFYSFFFPPTVIFWQFPHHFCQMGKHESLTYISTTGSIHLGSISCSGSMYIYYIYKKVWR